MTEEATMTEIEKADLVQQCFDIAIADTEHMKRASAAHGTLRSLNSRLAAGANVAGLVLLAFDEMQSAVTASRTWALDTPPPAGLPPDVSANVSEGLRLRAAHWESINRYTDLAKQATMARVKGRSGADVLRKEKRALEHQAMGRELLAQSNPLVRQVASYPMSLLQQMETGGTPATAEIRSL